MRSELHTKPSPLRRRGLLLLLSAALAPLSVPGFAAPKPPETIFVRALPTDSSRVDVASAVLPIEDGALVAGWTSLPGAPADGLLLRLDERGDVVWRKHLGGAGADLLFGLRADPRGGFACAGMTTTADRAPDGWLVHFDETGAIHWQRALGGPEEDRIGGLRASGDGWIAAGQTSRGGNVDAWLLRLDAEGRELASYIWGAAATERALDVEPAPDGGWVIVGRVGDGRDEVDGFVTRVAADGREAWTRTVGGAGFQVAYHLRAAKDGGWRVTGYGFAGKGRDHDGYTMRVSLDGKISRHERFGRESYDRATQSVELDDGSSIAVGYTRAVDAADDQPVWTTVLYGLDRGGKEAWSRRLEGAGVQSGRDIARRGDRVWVVGQVSEGGASGLQVALLALGRASGEPRL